MQEEHALSSLDRLPRLLKCFSLDELELSAADISQKVGMPRSTTYRMLKTLIKWGLLERSSKSSKYTVGPALYTAGNLYLKTTDTIRTTEPIAKMLNDLTNETISMCILNGGNVVFIMIEEAKYAFRWIVHVGSISPAYAYAMGRALLSELNDQEIDILYPEEILRPVTPKTIVTKTELKQKLALIRKTGISFDKEGSVEGIETIASVVRNYTGRAIAAMSIAVPIFRINNNYCKQLAALVKMSTNLISYRLGYQDTRNSIHSIEEIVTWWEQRN